jgi:hypothetical protein
MSKYVVSVIIEGREQKVWCYTLSGAKDAKALTEKHDKRAVVKIYELREAE